MLGSIYIYYVTVLLEYSVERISLLSPIQSDRIEWQRGKVSFSRCWGRWMTELTSIFWDSKKLISQAHKSWAHKYAQAQKQAWSWTDPQRWSVWARRTGPTGDAMCAWNRIILDWHLLMAWRSSGLEIEVVVVSSLLRSLVSSSFLRDQ